MRFFLRFALLFGRFVITALIAFVVLRFVLETYPGLLGG